MKEIFDQENPDARGEVSQTKPIDEGAVEIGTKFGVGEVPEFDDRADQSRIGAIRRGLGSQSTPSKTEMKARISVEDEVQESQLKSSRRRAEAGDSTLIKASRNPFIKGLMFAAMLPAAWLGIKGAKRTVEHLRNYDKQLEQTDYANARRGMQTEVKNMESQVLDPNLPSQERERLEKNLSTTEQNLDQLDENHSAYVQQNGSDVKTTNDGMNVTLPDGSKYTSTVTNETESK